MKKININKHIMTYEAGKTTRDGFTRKWIVEIIETDEMFDAWLSLGDGFKSYIVGLPKWQEYRKEWTSFADFLEWVEYYLPTSKKIYLEDLEAMEADHAARLVMDRQEF